MNAKDLILSNKPIEAAKRLMAEGLTLTQAHKMVDEMSAGIRYDLLKGYQQYCNEKDRVLEVVKKELLERGWDKNSALIVSIDDVLAL